MVNFAAVPATGGPVVALCPNVAASASPAGPSVSTSCDLSAAALGHPEHQNEAQKSNDGQCRNVRGCGHAEGAGQQDDARTPLPAGPLHGMGDADAGVNAAIHGQSGQDLG